MSTPKHLQPLPPRIYMPVLALMMLVVGALGFYAWTENKIIQDTEERAAVALRDFMAGSSGAASKANGVDLYLQNVRFYWTDKVHLDANHLNAKAIPVGKTGVVNFDDPNSYMVAMGKSDIALTPGVLGGMFNEGVFNYPGSKLRDLSVAVVPYEHGNRIRLSGEINYLFWIPFEMITSLTIDHASNTLVMTVDDLHVFNIIPARPVIQLPPFTMEKILTLPENRQLAIDRNKILIKPFGLFPPPRVTGRFEDINIHPNNIVISFAPPGGINDSLGRNQGGNIILLKGGQSRFANMIMRNTDLRVEDANPKTAFYFRLPTYKAELPESRIHMNANQSLNVVMPDAPH